ncbi:AAA domain-containing protein [Sporosarcina limicola]|uniref:DNA polymerase III delta prime subunit n=1 Tax=Sporosarcina limicola TaxID=34101 RepID=A0A927MMI0_9BACL|nr:AAA domain-containing protein [Sporosarcina limicola]MBE1555627.1 DNA polymerase III delta prime subunit [Sporosarcina limicola]
MKQESAIQKAIQKAIRCELGVTDNARKGIMKFAKDERALFSMQEAFDVHIEKRPENRHGNMSFSIFFDNVTNTTLAAHLSDRVAVMECVYKNEGFLATGFHVRGRREPVRTNRRLAVRLKFNVGRTSGAAMPIELYTSIRELPIAEERSAYVKKRVASWEGYLRIQEKNADVADITVSFSRASLNEDFSKLSLVCSGLKGQDWNVIRGFSAKMKGQQSDIGNVINANRTKNVVEIELSPKCKEMARRNEWHPKSYKEVVFSNFAELSQVKRLRKGFKDLQDGLAANFNLEKILFEERPTVRISKKQKELVFHNELNKFQKEAVTGAMTSNDLYVIQGPPGTGKTTVISEICHQNVKAGLRTLVASQANLAVDNALGRLLSHQDIRILRYGRTDSIEEEGKKFIEENVALNWRSQTLHAVNEQLQSHSKREAQLENDLSCCGVELEQLQHELDLLTEKIRLKEIAQAEHLTHSNEISRLTKKIGFLTKELKEQLTSQAVLKDLTDKLAVEINRIEQVIQSQSISPETIIQMETVEKEIEQLRHYISYRQTLQQIGETVNTLAMIHKELEVKQSKINGLHVFLKEVQTIIKLDGLKNWMDSYGIIPPFVTNQKVVELNQLIGKIKSATSADTSSDWKKLNNRLLNAISQIERVLADHGYIKQTVKRSVNQKYTSVIDINGLIDRVARFLIEPSTKRVLDTRNYSAQKYDYLQKIATALDMLQERRNHAKAQEANLDKLNQLMLDSKKLFAIIRAEIIEFANQSISEIERDKKRLHQDTEGHEGQLNDLQQTSSRLVKRLGTVDENATISIVKEELAEKEEIHVTYQKTQASLKQYAYELENKKNDAEDTMNLMMKNTEALQLLNKDIELVHVGIGEREKQVEVLAEILEQNLDVQRHQALSTFDALSENVKVLKKDKKRLPITHSLQQEWLSLLTEANAYDLDEIRKLYVRHANVIGTTCVASARRDFMEEYPTFDVVIIDEVSKATPPELLLPMLKGKKIILVGDHHQLPPLVGQETIEEFLDEIDSQEEKNELKKLLKESLFERLFRTLPKQNKTMLGIQYRMHESIMETITPFYENGLQCGLTDSDAARDHLIESRYVQRNNHLLWFDMPNELDYFEDKVKGGTSRFNQAELTMIQNLLLDLEGATEQAKRDGRLVPDAKKSVGVISFYGEQVKRIDRLIQQDLMPQHLHCRTGSVDKFQGMEMDVIILSFVRNHQDKGGDIGFAKDYRRLNVALSRARELLIIVGSSDMFTIRTKDASSRAMYGRLLADIKKENGFRDHEGTVKL